MSQENENGRRTIDIGSCGLHNVHNAFRGGHESTKWEVDNWLFTMFYLFDESPARRISLKLQV